MNYTKPNDPDHKDDPKEWLNSALIFSGAVGTLLKANTGVVIDIKGDMFNPVGESNKVIVFNKDSMIHIDDFPHDLPEGSLCIIESEKDD